MNLADVCLVRVAERAGIDTTATLEGGSLWQQPPDGELLAHLRGG